MKSKMEKPQKEIWIIVGLLVLVLGALIFLMLTIPERANLCLKNPVQYYEYYTNSSCFCQNQLEINP
mgnify:CR=1 FL=1